MDAFSQLGLPVRLALETSEIEEAWRSATKAAHRDNKSAPVPDSPATPDLACLHQARDILLDPGRRLGEWLRILSPQAAAPTAISNEFMEVFSRLSSQLSRTDSLLGQHRKAGSTIARAVLARPLVEAQLALQGFLREIQDLRQARVARFPEWEPPANEATYDQAHRALHDLKFLVKWEREVNERLIELLTT
jgi:hypothetical protein